MHSNARPGRSSDAPTLADLAGPEALIFDLDGTLVDTVQLRIEAWRRALATVGVNAAPEQLAGYIGSDGRKLARDVAHEAGVELDYDASEEMDRLSGDLFDGLNESPVPLPGATELLTALEESHVTFAIATSSRPGQVAVSVAALRLPSPPPITDGSHVANAKPEPDLLIESAAQLGLPPEKCWYVGDSTWDMVASIRAKMAAIGVTTGAVDAEGLAAAGASVVVAGLTDLLAELRSRGILP